VRVLETERLVLRRLSVDDAGFILGLVNQPSWLRFIGDRGVRTEDDARRYILEGPVASYERFGYGLYRTDRKDTATPIGICGLVRRESLADPDIGFALLPEHWGNGFASEAAAAVMAYARDVLGLPRVVAVVSPDNSKSIRVLRKLGLQFERVVRLSPEESEIRLFAPPGPAAGEDLAAQPSKGPR
jgi:RimJ/RimL family protein N-acetyltransferase